MLNDNLRKAKCWWLWQGSASLACHCSKISYYIQFFGHCENFYCLDGWVIKRVFRIRLFSNVLILNLVLGGGRRGLWPNILPAHFDHWLRVGVKSESKIKKQLLTLCLSHVWFDVWNIQQYIRICQLLAWVKILSKRDNQNLGSPPHPKVNRGEFETFGSPFTSGGRGIHGKTGSFR